MNDWLFNKVIAPWVQMHYPSSQTVDAGLNSARRYAPYRSERISYSPTPFLPRAPNMRQN